MLLPHATTSPLAASVIDEKDNIQLEAIAAELNIFLTEPVVYRGPYEYSVPGAAKDFTPQFESEHA